MSEEPIFAHRESGMLLKCPNQQLSFPDADSPMGKGSASQFARKSSLHAGNLVLYILCLLTERSLGAFWANTFDGITNHFDVVYEPIRNDGKIRRKKAIVIDQKDIGEVLCNIAANVLRDDLWAQRRPRMRHTIAFAYWLSAIQRCWGVAVGNYLHDHQPWLFIYICENNCWNHLQICSLLEIS